MMRAKPIFTLAAALLLAGCAELPAAKQAQLDRLECRAHALAPVVEPLFDAAELVLDLYAGRASLPAILQAVGAGEAEVRALLEALKACDPQAPPPVVEPG